MPIWMDYFVSACGASVLICLGILGWVIRRFLSDYQKFKDEVLDACSMSREDHEELCEYESKSLEHQEELEKIRGFLEEVKKGQEEIRRLIGDFRRRTAQSDQILLTTMLKLCKESSLDCADIEALYAAYRDVSFKDLAAVVGV